MINVLIAVAAAGAGYILGTRGARRVIDERIDERLAELQNKLHTGAPARAPEAAAAAPAKAEVKPAPVPLSGPPSTAAQPGPAPVTPVQEPQEEEISPEVLTVITAAICAFLGKPTRIRRVRRVPAGSSSWAQVGRVSVMASHTFSRH